MAERVPEWYREVIEVRSLLYTITHFVLDNCGDSNKLDELDEKRQSPLHVAIHTQMTDCVELMLARGANPDSRIGDTTPREYLYGKSLNNPCISVEIFEIFDMQVLLQHWKSCGQGSESEKYVSVCWQGSDPWFTDNEFIDIELGKMFPIRPYSFGHLSPEWVKTWVHVPFINVTVLNALSRTVQGLAKGPIFPYVNFSMARSFTQSFDPPSIQPGNPLLLYRDSNYRISDDIYSIFATTMVFPCLTLRPMRAFCANRDRYKKLLAPSSSRFRPWLGVCLDRTLDESYFPSMDDAFFKGRNRDQVVTKEWRRRWSDKGGKDPPILMVPQLWLWSYPSTLLSAGSINLESDAHSDLTKDSTGPRALRFLGHNEASNNLHIGLLIAMQITKFGKKRVFEDGTVCDSTLNMFETAVISTLYEVQQYLDGSPQSKTIEEQKKSERTFIHNISDIHGELDMISSVLDQQKSVMDMYLDKTSDQQKEAQGFARDSWDDILRARKSLDEYQNRIEKIHRDADRVEKTIESFLSLKRTYASIEDTRNSLVMGFAASAFAFVTVIFTPLSFMASLFALPVDHFVRHQTKDGDDSKVYKFSFIGGYTALAGIVTWMLTAALLFYLYYYWKNNSRSQEAGKTLEALDEAGEPTQTVDKDKQEPRRVSSIIQGVKRVDFRRVVFRGRRRRDGRAGEV